VVKAIFGMLALAWSSGFAFGTGVWSQALDRPPAAIVLFGLSALGVIWVSLWAVLRQP
jgi:hypothetical protein